MTAAEALSSLLESEYAAIYAYGVLGARLDERTRATALAAYDAHRARRDDLLARLRAAGRPVPTSPASYDLAVADVRSALALAVRVETDLGVRWRDLVGTTDDAGLRRLGVQGLRDSAVRAARWRQVAGTAPVTEALPGQA